MKKVTVLGGLGFIGLNFVKSCLERDLEVTVIDKMSYAAEFNRDFLPKGVRLEVLDLASDSIPREFSKSDVVVNFAAESHNDRSIDEPFDFVRNNVLSALNALEFCRANSLRYHHISTDEVFGDLPLDASLPFGPESRYLPSSPYSASKASADMVFFAWSRTYDIKATASRCSNNYGLYQHPEKLIPKSIIRLLRHQPLELYGDGRNIRDWIHVEDHVSGIWAAITDGLPGVIYDFSGGQKLTNLQIAEKITEAMGRETEEIQFVQDRPGHDRKYWVDDSKTRAELSWGPQKGTLAENLPEMIDFYTFLSRI